MKTRIRLRRASNGQYIQIVSPGMRLPYGMGAAQAREFAEKQLQRLRHPAVTPDWVKYHPSCACQAFDPAQPGSDRTATMTRLNDDLYQQRQLSDGRTAYSWVAAHEFGTPTVPRRVGKAPELGMGYGRCALTPPGIVMDDPESSTNMTCGPDRTDSGKVFW